MKSQLHGWDFIIARSTLNSVKPEQKLFSIIALASLVTGMLIFLFAHGGIIRNYGGDVVAIALLYSVAMLLKQKPIIAATGVMAVAMIIEITQAFVTLPQTATTRLTLGSTFDPVDIVVYLGTALLLLGGTALILPRDR